MSSTKKLSAEKYSAMPFFKFTLRHNLVHLALYAVVAVLAMILPALLAVNDITTQISRRPEWNYLHSVRNDMLVVAALGIFVAGVIALIAGMSTLSYVNSKTGVGCYHSFPMKREVLLGCESLTRVIYFAAVMIFGYGVSYLIMAAALPADGISAGSGDYWLLALSSVFVFLTVYSLLLFSAGLTGNAVTRLLMAGLIVCLPAALYALIIAFAGIGIRDLYDSYYLNEEILKNIFLPVRGYYGIVELVEYGRIGELLTTLIDTAFYTAGAFLLHKYRRSEHSGTSIIWKPVFLTVKLAVVITCTLFGAWFFSAAIGSANDVIALLFGAVIGGVVSFIVTNCILYRSSRAMFRGIKSFAAVMVVVVVFLFLVPLNATGKLGDYYAASFTDKFVMRLRPYGSEIVFDTPEEVKMVHELITSNEKMFSSDTYLDVPNGVFGIHKTSKEEEGYVFVNDGTLNGIYGKIESVGIEMSEVRDRSVYSYNITLIQYPKVGIPLAVNTYSDMNSEFTKRITSSDSFAEAMNIAENIDIESIEDMTITLDNRILSFYSFEDGMPNQGMLEINGENSGFGAEYLAPHIENILENAVYTPEYREAYPVVGSISIYYKKDEKTKIDASYDRGNITLPVYACDVELVDAIEYAMVSAAGYLDGISSVDYKSIESPEDYFRRAYKRSGGYGAYLISCESGRYVQLTEDELIGIGAETSAFVGAGYASRDFEIIGECDYAIVIPFDEKVLYDGELVVRFRGDDSFDKVLEEKFFK